MNQKTFVILSVVILIIVVWSTDVAAGMFDALGMKRKPKPPTQGG